MRYNQSVIIDPRKILPSRHSIFIRGFPGTIKLEDVKELFSKQSDGKCKIDFFSYSDDKSQLFLAIRFESHQVAKRLIEKYDGERLLGHRVEISWFKDIRKARKKVIENEHKYHGLLASFDSRRRPYGRFPIRRAPMGARRFGNPNSNRYYGPPVVRQRVSSSNSSDSDSHSSSGSENSRRSRGVRRRCSPRRNRRSSSYSSHSSGPRRRRFAPPPRRLFNHSPRSGSGRSRSPSSSSFSSGSPSHRPAVGKSTTYQYDLHTEEKEILQAALAACSSPKPRVSTQERSASEASRKRSPKRVDLGPINSPEQASPVAEPVSPASPRRKREKRSKKHRSARRHGKRKRRDLEADDESPRPQTPLVEMDEAPDLTMEKPNGHVEDDGLPPKDSLSETQPGENAMPEDVSLENICMPYEQNESAEPEGSNSNSIENEPENTQHVGPELPKVYMLSVSDEPEISHETNIFPAGKFKPVSEVVEMNLESQRPPKSWLYSPTERIEVKLKSTKPTTTPSSLTRFSYNPQFEETSPFIVTPSRQEQQQWQQQQQQEREMQAEQQQQQPASPPITIQSPPPSSSPPPAVGEAVESAQTEKCSPAQQFEQQESQSERNLSQDQPAGTELVEDLPSMELDSPESPEQMEPVVEKQNQVDMATQTTMGTDNEELNPLVFSYLSDQKLDEIFQRKRLIEAAYRLDCESYTNSITNLIRTFL